MQPAPPIVISVHMFATVAMTGIIWFVQIVHYPLFIHYDHDSFGKAEATHQRRTGWIVIPLMVAEAVSAVLLVVTPPSQIDRTLPVIGLLILGMIWVSTFFLQVPCHRALSDGFDESTIRKLVRSNWIRTVGWSCRTMIVLGMLLNSD